MDKPTTRKHLTLYNEQIDWANENHINLSEYTREAIDEKREREQ